jgi:catechol 2,3-dioxygenase-like lactoylglutathione lyase family enzyme
MLSLHHTHLFASDVDRSIAFWRDHFGGVVLVDTVFAGARNVFMRIGEGRLHLYDQAPKHAMAQGPDGILLELFQPHAGRLSRALVEAGYFATVRRERGSRRSVADPGGPDGT